MRPLITLLTDFGLSDTYVGQMKGVLYQLCPEARIVDLTHQIPPQNVLVGAVKLADAVAAFAPGTIHVGVVDPGVGTERHAIAIEFESFTFVGPDNGLATALLAEHKVRRAVRLMPEKCARPAMSSTFHGRDLFAPAAAYLAQGEPAIDLGQPLGAPVTIDLPKPTTDGDGRTIRGQVLYADHFGNMVSNIRKADLDAASAQQPARPESVSDAPPSDAPLAPANDDDAESAPVPEPTQPASPKGAKIELRQSQGDATAGRDWHVTLDDQPVGPLRQTFADVAEGELVAYLGSSERVEIARRGGNAAVGGSRAMA